MATTRTTITDPKTGDTANIYADTKLPTQLSEKEIDTTLAEASKTLGMEKAKLSQHGKTLVEDTQALIDTTRKNELFQKLFAFVKKGEEGAEGVPSEELQVAGRTLMERVTGMASSLQTDAADLASYIRGEIYNYLTSGEYRDLLSEFYTIIKELAAQIESETEEPDVGQRKKQKLPKQQQPQRRGAWNKPLELPEQFSEQVRGQVQQHLQQQGVKELEEKKAKQEQVAEQVKPQLPQQVQPSGREAPKEKTKEAEDKALDELQDRFNNFLSRLSEKEEYQSLVKNFFKYSDQVYDLMIDVTEDAQRTPEARQARELIDKSYEILSDFAGRKEVEKYRKDLKDILNKIKDDKELQQWRQETRSYILDVLKNPDISEKNVDKVKGLLREGRQILQKYRGCIDVLYDDQVKLAQAVKDDPTLQDFNRKLRTLGSHLALNSKGEVDPAKLQESMSQIANLVANMFHSYLAKLPLTKVDIQTTNYDLQMSDIKVRGTGFAPDMMEINTKSNSTLHFVEGKTNRSCLLVSFSVANICPSFEDFKYSFNKKSFPTYTDSGRATISTWTNDGLSIDVSIMIKSEGSLPPKASLKSLWVRLGSLQIETSQQTQHSILTPLLAPFFAETVRMRIETLIYNQLRSRFDDVIFQLNEFFTSNPIEKVTHQIATNIQSNLPEEKIVQQSVEQTTSKA